MMRVWIEVWQRGRQILGNGAGQGAIVAKDYTRTAAYKRVRYGALGIFAYPYSGIVIFKVCTDDGRVLRQWFRHTPDRVPIVGVPS